VETRIAHLSDIHMERGDLNVSDRLVAALKKLGPHILVASGDFADQPWHVHLGGEWLEKVRKACGVDKSNVIVVPGNHDYGIYGNVGVKSVTGRGFGRQFPDWDKPRVVLMDGGGTAVAFFKVDSNPLILNFARGRVWSSQLKRIGRELDAKTPEERAKIEAATKILVVHHHPFPVPYEGKDTFLMLKNAQPFIQFLAERKIDIVLHGHKHRAPHSLIELGTCIGRTRAIEVVGAGTAIAKNDQDKRGNNFNIIVVENNGLRYVRQFFAQPGEKFEELPGESFSINAFESSYRRALVRNYQYNHVHWDVQIGQEGDANMLTSYVGTSAVGGYKLEEIELPEMEVEKGHLWVSLHEDLEKTSEGVKLHPQIEAHKAKLKITFRDSPTEALPANFAVSSYAFNAFAVDLEEFRKKYPKKTDDIEWAMKTVAEPMEQLSFALQFPSEPPLVRPPWFDVLPSKVVQPGGGNNPDGDKPHEWLTRELKHCFQYSDVLNTAFLSVRKPPVGYIYRISWHVPKGKPVEGKPDFDGQRRLKAFKNRLLEMRTLMLSPPEPGSKQSERLNELRPTQEEVNKVLAVFADSVFRRIQEKEKIQKLEVDPDKLDITLMVYDDSEQGESPILRTAAGGSTLDDLKFSLEVGDGSAGRAYKTRTFVSYDSSKDDPSYQAYVRRPKMPQHQLLCSIPLLDPRSPTLIFGILNFGTFSEDDAKLLRTLDAQDYLEWISNQAQSYVLTRLFQALSIE